MPVATRDEAAETQDLAGAAFHRDRARAAGVVRRDDVVVLLVPKPRLPPLVAAVQLDHVHADSARKLHDRKLGAGAAVLRAGGELGHGHLGGKQRCLRERGQRRRGRHRHSAGGSNGSRAVDLPAHPFGNRGDDLHPVLCQRAGLVEAERVERAQPLHRVQTAHEQVLRAHAA